MADFVHLHCHTEYSLLDGAIRIKDACARAKDFGMPACAITDHGNMFGAAYFFQGCKDIGIKPVFGCEVYVCHDHTDKNADSPLSRVRHHLILLARDMTGYHNLVKLVTAGYLEGYYYKPRVDKPLLRKYAEGLTCLSACIAGEIPRAITGWKPRKKGESDPGDAPCVITPGNLDRARALIHEYAGIFPGHFYLELQSNGLKVQEQVNTALMELAESEKLPLVATNDCHYLNKDDAEAHEVLLCIQTQTTMDDPERMKFNTDELYFKSAEDMEKSFSHVPEALANTMRIAEECNVELDFGHHYFPVYKLPEGMSLDSEFRKLAEEGLEKRLEKHPNREHIDKQVYRDRLQHELKVILEMGFPGYFLIVQEFINWAKNHGVPVGPGRGSAAGSLVAWALRITNLDPLPYNLLFERFLNIERVSLPDIDVDFCERRRTEVIRHMVDTYGADSVAQITTFGTMKAKGVVRDVGRALGMSFAETDRIAKLVPADLKMTIKKALETEPDLAEMYKTDSKVRHLLDTAQRLEGLARHASTHAAGLVVSDKPMVEYLPLYLGKRDELVTQFDGPMTEKTGLVKFDFLGLKTMTLIQDTLDNISLQGQTPPDLDNLALTDQETYDLYSRGDTDGVFQVESSGMRQYLRMLKPSCFEDVIAMLALYRPGPLGSGMVDEFIKRKHGQVPVVYPHPSLEGCLRDTYGVIVYQEQVMQIAQIIASYTLGGADLLRRAMGKKKAEAMAKERVNFVTGAAKNGIDKEKADEIFDLMEKFAAYGFNKSHSAAYALISYFTAYLKVHHKVEFMAALMTSEMGNQDKLLKYVSCCKDMDIPVTQASVNVSRREFTAHGGQVVFGLGGVKNVGDEAIREIVDAREQDGPYASLFDLCCRVNLRKVTKRVLESLIKGGACDCFSVPRAAMLASLDLVVARAQKKARDKTSNQVSLLAMAPAAETAPMPGVGLDCPEAAIPEMPDDERLKAEKEALGFFLTSHPLQPFSREIRRLGLTTLEDAREMFPGAEIRCAALVTSIKEVLTKSKGERMAFVGIEDLTGHGEVTFFPKPYAACRELLHADAPICLAARLDKQQAEDADPTDADGDAEEAPREIKLLGQHVMPLAEACGNSDTPVCVHIPENRLGREDMLALRNILERFPGPVETHAQVRLDGHLCLLHLDAALKVSPGPELDKALTAWAS
ncbi:MAG: DNA polymerase III subunit alpha [Desulfovibrio sp.]|nr:DNA polymerase III subunit alpha [Desulfovibrio sp.]